MKRKVTWILLGTIILAIIYFVMRENRSSKNVEYTANSFQTMISKHTTAVTKTKFQEDNSNVPLFIQKNQCLQINKDYNKMKSLWLKQSHSVLEELAQSYEFNSVFKAMIGTIGSSSASSAYFKITREKIHSSYRQVEHSSLKKELVANLGNSAIKSYSINWSIVPNEILIEVTQFRPEDIDSLLTAGRYDVPYDIIFDNVVDLSRNFKGMTSSRGPNNLLERISLANRPDLLDLYFKNGGLAKEVVTGTNALEKLLLKVTKENLGSYAEVIRVLNKSGLAVRYAITPRKLLELGQFIRVYSNLTLEDIHELESLGIQFITAETEETAKEDPKYLDLAHAIVENRDEFIKHQLQVESLDKYRQCRRITEKVNNVLRSHEKAMEAGRVFENFSGDFNTFQKKLYEIEPGLTDCVGEGKRLSTKTVRSKIRYEDIAKIAELYQEQGIHQVIAEAQKLDLSNSEKDYLVWRLEGDDSTYLQFLSDYGLLPDSFSMLNLIRAKPSTIEALSELGIDFDFPSDIGRSLVESAAAQCNTDLVNWMAAQNFTYQFSDIRSDALAISLRARCPITQNKFDLVSAVMRFAPSVKNYHQQRLAELRLSDYQLFTKLAETFPQLNIEDEVAPSGLICDTISISSNERLGFAF